MSFLVVRPGLHTLVVDLGRPHSRHLGMPVGGAADRQLYQLGNAILHNDLNAPALEVTQTGPILAAKTAMACVFMGQWFSPQILNRGPLTSGISFQLDPEDELHIGATKHQLRGYLCVTGGFQLEQFLGSRSSLKPIQAGDRLEAFPSRSHHYGICSHATFSSEAIELRILPGSQSDWIDVDRFVKQTFIIDPTSNRMGVRLIGKALQRRNAEMISEPVVIGTIQLTNDGLPIILGVDCQTIGGYPKIAYVIAADLDKLAQLRPHQAVRFVWTEPAEAKQAWDERQREFAAWQTRLNCFKDEKTT